MIINLINTCSVLQSVVWRTTTTIRLVVVLPPGLPLPVVVLVVLVVLVHHTQYGVPVRRVPLNLCPLD